MNANEFRLGNYVTDKLHYGGARIIQITHIQEASEFKDFFSNIEPIELTDDLILDCGGTFKEYGFSTGNMWKQWNINGYSFNQNGKYLDFNSCNVTIKYLHQLQNLYFALSEKELNINLK